MTTNSSLELLKDLNFCVFDLETTGGNHQNDKIIEIGLVQIKNLQIVSQKSFLINPEIHIPDFIQKLTNIKEADVKDAPLIEDVIDEILEFMGDSILVAHNTSFDVPFLNSVLRRLNKPELSNKAICTNLMTKYMIPNLLSSNLNYMCKIFNLRHQKAHRALDDTTATAELLLKYLSIFAHKNIHKINSLYYPKNKFEMDRINFKRGTPFNEIVGLLESLNTPLLITLKGTEGIVLFSFPTLSTPAELEYIAQKIQETSFEILTIKMIGPFFQGLIEMSTYFSKISGALQNEIIKKLCEFHNIQFNDVNSETLIDFSHDFIIMNHLIPEQFVIYPMRSLHHKMELVFRYPTHQNKLVQYINSKSARIGQSKLKKDHLAPLINNFLAVYLQQSTNYLLLNRNNAKIDSSDLKAPIEIFMDKNPNEYNFPKLFL